MTPYARWLPPYPELPDELPIVIGITAYGYCEALPSARRDGSRRAPASPRTFDLRADPSRPPVTQTIPFERLIGLIRLLTQKPCPAETWL